MTERELIDRLLFLAETAVDQALDLNYDDPEDYFIYRELRELKAAALAQPEPQGPTDRELLMLMPETMRDEFSYAAKTCSDVMGGRVKPDIFRVALNTAALEYARAALARWGRPAIEPVLVSERPPGPEDCDAEGRCWWWNVTMDPDSPNWWSLESIEYIETEPYWLPHWALPVPGVEGGND